MSEIARLEEPDRCRDEERRQFARLVRAGFPVVTEPLEDRIRAARWLAFHQLDDGTVAGIAALKQPGAPYVADLFTRTAAGAAPADYPFELGWVFVPPDHRGRGIGVRLARLLLAREPRFGVFATTRIDNVPMIRILESLGFRQAGAPYPRRDEELHLFLRP